MMLLASIACAAFAGSLAAQAVWRAVDHWASVRDWKKMVARLKLTQQGRDARDRIRWN